MLESPKAGASAHSVAGLYCNNCSVAHSHIESCLREHLRNKTVKANSPLRHVPSCVTYTHCVHKRVG